MSGGVYGNQLSHFGELMDTYIAYRQTPNVGAGYTRIADSEVTIRGIMQNTEGSAFNIKNAYAKSSTTGNSMVSVTDASEFWSEQNLKLRDYCIEYEDAVFRFMSNGSFNKEGGFYAYTIERIVGNDGRASSTEVNIIAGSLQ